MRIRWLLVVLVALGVAGCINSTTPTPTPLAPVPSPRSTETPTPSPSAAVAAETATLPATTATYVGDLGEQSIHGTIREAASNLPIANAIVSYEHFSYFRPGSMVTTTTGANGEFVFDPLFLHDTDAVRVRVEAPDHAFAEIQRSGLETFYNPVFDFTLAVTPPATLPASSTPAPPLASTPTPALIAPSILSFTVSPREINPGEPVTLTWSAVGEKATLWRLDPLGRLSEFYDVPLSGSMTLTTSQLLRNQVTFMLFATSGEVNAQATVSATITCPDVWFFPNPPKDCPASPPNATAMAAQHFEHGMMLWTQVDDRIYILYDDNPDVHFRHWTVASNAWFSGMPESDPNLVPPPGYYQPVRGFGMAWRDEQATPGYRVRDRLGWATDEEFSLSGAFQCNAAPKYRDCYITGPDNRVYILEAEGSGWYVWMGP
jgi:hypothetical protein